MPPPGLFLPPSSEDDTSCRGKAGKKQSAKNKSKEKWNSLCQKLWFIPTPVLECKGASGRRLGLQTFDRLTCCACRHTFHKASGLALHDCPGCADCGQPVPKELMAAHRWHYHPAMPDGPTEVLGGREEQKEVEVVEVEEEEEEEVEVECEVLGGREREQGPRVKVPRMKN
jgi:hypothetical protein